MEYRTKEEQVADFLREGIIAGRFPRGTRLKQLEIAKMLRISITPVREALKLLAAEGYVAGDSYRGATVAPFDISASNEILHLRILLESHLVGGAVEHATAADIEEIRTLAIEFERAVVNNQNELARAANYRFHRQIHDIPNMPQTLHLVQILWARYPFDIINKLEGRVERAVAEHAELLKTFINKDVTGAMLATRRHIESGWLELQQTVQPEEPASREAVAAKPRPIQPQQKAESQST